MKKRHITIFLISVLSIFKWKIRLFKKIFICININVESNIRKSYFYKYLSTYREINLVLRVINTTTDEQHLK